MTVRALLGVALLLTSVGVGLPVAGADSIDLAAGAGSADAAATGSTATAAAPATNASGNLTVRTLGAPRSATDRFDSPANVSALRRAGLLTNTSSVPLNATLVVELGVPGLAGELDAANGSEGNASNATTRFQRAVAAANVSLAVRQTNPGTSQQVIELDIVNASATRVVSDPANDTYYLVVDLRALNAARDADDPGTNADRTLRGDEAFRLNLSVPRSSSLAVSGWAATSLVVPNLEASVQPQYDGSLRIPPVGNATVTGTTSLLPGSRVTVRLAVGDDDGAGDGGSVHGRTVAVTAGAKGPRYVASFDLADVPNGTPVAVSVVGRTGPLTFEPVRGFVVAPTASLSFVESPQWYGPEYVRVDARLAYPGSVVIHAGSADGPVVGARALRAGAHDFVRIELDRDVARNRTLVAVVAWDADGDHNYDAGDPIITQNGSPVSDDMVFAPAIETATTRTTSTTTTSTATSTTTRGQPGFGVGVALAALAAAALLARP